MYELSPKGMVRGAIIHIEDTVQQRTIGDLNQQERASVLADTQALLQYLEAHVTTAPSPRSLTEALENINLALDRADREMRLLTQTEEATVIDNARSIQLLLLP
jgi:hypothetical protein